MDFKYFIIIHTGENNELIWEDKQMDKKMTEYTFKPYVKYLVLDIGIFQSELVDERNFDPADTKGIEAFLRKYNRFDNYFIVSVEM